MKLLNYSIITLLFLASCQAKTEQADDAVVHSKAQPITDLNTVEALSSGKSFAQVASSRKAEIPDTLENVEKSLDCYVWSNTYLATTDVVSEEGDHYELHIAITLNEGDGDNYTGVIEMFLSDDEDGAFRGSVKANAEQNFVTVYFDKNIEGMEDMFKNGDKLVQFDYSYGEIVASWFGVMSPYVDEYTILSLAQ